MDSLDYIHHRRRLVLPDSRIVYEKNQPQGCSVIAKLIYKK